MSRESEQQIFTQDPEISASPDASEPDFSKLTKKQLIVVLTGLMNGLKKERGEAAKKAEIDKIKEKINEKLEHQDLLDRMVEKKLWRDISPEIFPDLPISSLISAISDGSKFEVDSLMKDVQYPELTDECMETIKMKQMQIIKDGREKIEELCKKIKKNKNVPVNEKLIYKMYKLSAADIVNLEFLAQHGWKEMITIVNFPALFNHPDILNSRQEEASKHIPKDDDEIRGAFFHSNKNP